MEVVLCRDVSGLGKKGDVVSVKDGYARNYLIPKGLATEATKGVLREQEALRQIQKQKSDRVLAEAEENARKISGQVLVIKAKAGQGRIFGSVTPQEIASRLQAKYGVAVDKRKVLLDESLKSLGIHEVQVQLHPKVKVSFSVDIRPEVDN